MIPRFQSTGLLPPGIHTAAWREVETRFGFTPKRRRLLAGLRQALLLLKRAGCRRVYLDGSFVTTKPNPGDIDVCWAIAGVDPEVLDAVFLDFAQSRARQKARFCASSFPRTCRKASRERPFWSSLNVTKRQDCQKAL